MKGATRAELQALLADEFDKQGWQYDLTTGKRLVDKVVLDGGVDAVRLATSLPSEFFHKNDTNRELVADAINRAIGGRTVQEEAAVPTTVVIGGNNYQLNIGEGALVTNSNINVGEGTQINVHAEASKDDVLTGVEALVRAGLTGDWSAEAADALAELIDGRADITHDDVHRVTTEVALGQQARQSRVREFLTIVAAQGLGGVLASGLITGLAEAMSQLPT